jgi:hypothetical protein
MVGAVALAHAAGEVPVFALAQLPVPDDRPAAVGPAAQMRHRRSLHQRLARKPAEPAPETGSVAAPPGNRLRDRTGLATRAS